jgi:serine/threonine protein kinase
MTTTSEQGSVEFLNSISRGGIASGDGDAPRSCQDSGNLSKNLPIYFGSRTNSNTAQNSVAQNSSTKSDLPCQRHHQQQTELPKERMGPAVTRTNQRNSPRSTNNVQHQSPKKSMTCILHPSQKRFSSAANGQKNHYKHQQKNNKNNNIRTRSSSSDIFFDLTPAEQSSSSVETTMMKEQHQDPVPTMEPEIDTRDSASSGPSLPLHRMLEVESQSVVEEHLAQLAAAERRSGTTPGSRGAIAMEHRAQVPSQSHDTSAPGTPTSSTPPRTQTAPSSLPKRKSSRKQKKLTLSAYRKPEEAVRLTECDASRLLENEYNLRAPGCKVIGHGAFSTVRSALRNSDGTKVAIKSISKFDALRARRLRRPKGSKHMDEWEIMKLLKHNPYVLTLYDVFETEEEIHLVTEFCCGGELFDAIKRKSTQRSSFRRGRFSESQAARITNQILKALAELHDIGIVHRDIKAENILLLNSDDSEFQVKLCDFGMARLHQRCQQTTPQEISSDGEASPSTPGLLFGYSVNAPPEGCHRNCIGPATDIFSLGATLYILLCGFPPVFCDNVVEFPEAYWDDISEEAKDIVRSMLHHDPKQRISAKDALKNAWITQETTNSSIRRSISVNLELVRARLLRSLGDAAGRSMSSPTPTSKRRGFASSSSSTSSAAANTMGGPNKRARLSSLDLSLNALYNCSEKRDVRVIEERVESRAIAGEERGEGMACS